MNNQKRIKVVSLIGILTLLIDILSGCVHHKIPDIPIVGSKPTVKAEPLPFPEGVSLTGLYMTQQGMERGPYYILKETDNGTFMKITDTDPQVLSIGNQDAVTYNLDDSHFYFADTVLDEEYASLARLEDVSPVRELEETIVQSGALRWDGWDKKGNVGGGLFEVMDSGDSYELYLELSDGTSVTMHGYDIHPEGWNDLFSNVADIFEKYKDYSH